MIGWVEDAARDRRPIQVKLSSCRAAAPHGDGDEVPRVIERNGRSGHVVGKGSVRQLKPGPAILEVKEIASQAGFIALVHQHLHAGPAWIDGQLYPCVDREVARGQIDRGIGWHLDIVVHPVETQAVDDIAAVNCRAVDFCAIVATGRIFGRSIDGARGFIERQPQDEGARRLHAHWRTGNLHVADLRLVGLRDVAIQIDQNAAGNSSSTRRKSL